MGNKPGNPKPHGCHSYLKIPRVGFTRIESDLASVRLSPVDIGTRKNGKKILFLCVPFCSFVFLLVPHASFILMLIVTCRAEALRRRVRQVFPGSRWNKKKLQKSCAFVCFSVFLCNFRQPAQIFLV